MHSFKIEMAETVVAVDVLYESSQKLCKDYFTNKPAEISVTITEEDVENERRFATSANPSGPRLESMALYRKICKELAYKDIVLIHGSCVAVDGQAYLFCAPSGTGKSTHTRFWREYFGDRAVMINDDKPLVRAMDDGSARIYGTPWNGKHKLGSNISAPLKAICFLDRGKENEIERFYDTNALPMLLRYTFRPEDPAAMAQVLDSTTKIANKVDFWNLKCNMSREAAEISYTAMSEALGQ